MIAIRTPEELVLMREGGKKLGVILQDLLEFSKTGVTLLDIDAHADKRIGESGGTASFKTVRGYKWATCLCVNDVVVHGIPTNYKLKDGDIFTIDVGILYKGFHTDTAWTKVIDEKETDFLRVGQDALRKAIGQARPGNRVGNISKALEDTIVGAGYSIVKSLVGHGVGRELHEDPQIPGFIRGKIESTPLLEPGMTIAIEAIYAKGSGQIIYDHPDGWTLATKDHGLSAVFEHTLVIRPSGPVVLTEVDR